MPIHQVLARKWRPKNFSEVVGQEHTLRALINALRQNRLHHAYLFTGTRGIGKTTLARILAKCLNCETGVTDTPCGKCENCIEVDKGVFIDLIEVDAASRTKVEDTRELLENVLYAPAKGRFKIYLIDEVHMLSGHSFNALLKTLEEPPKHVKFLFATTDPQKLPITILSRCLQFNLKILPPELIQKHLQHVSDQEKLAYEIDALLKLAIAAQGSVRDALSLLDQSIAYCGEKITNKEIADMLGSIEHKHILNILDALNKNDAHAILETIAEIAEAAIDFAAATDELLDILHKIALTQIAPNVSLSSFYDVEQIRKLANCFSKEDTQLYYQIALIGKRDLFLTPNPKNGFEMIMLRMLAFRPNNAAYAKQKPLSTAGVQKTSVTNGANEMSKQTKTPQPQIAAKNIENNADKNYNDILLHLKLTGPTKALMQHCKIESIDENFVTLIIEAGQAPFINKTQEDRLSSAFTEYFQRNMAVAIKIEKDIDTLAKQKINLDRQRQDHAAQNISQDAKVNDIINKFGAEIVPNSTRDNKTE